VRHLALVLLTSSIFAGVEASFLPRLAAAGVPLEQLAVLGLVLSPARIQRHVAAPPRRPLSAPLSRWVSLVPFRLAVGAATLAAVASTAA